MSAVRLKTDN